MRSPWLRLIFSFVGIAVLFAGYRLLATPLLEPPRRAGADLSTVRFSGPLKSVERMPELGRWFKADAWELAYPQILETEYGTLLLKSYQTLEDGRLLIEPCTLVLKSDPEETAPDEAPIILQAPAGAILSFDRPLDLRKASVGKLVGGLLQGDIHIRRGATSTSPALNLVTRNVQIDESRIWTTQQVSFRYGQTHGSGRDLLITLPQMKPGRNQPAKTGNAPIRFMELVHVDRIHVDLQDLQQKETELPPKSGRPAPRSLDVTCEGPFRIDFLQQAAAFEKNVVLTLHHEGPQVDRLRCDLLAAYFAVDNQASDSQPVAGTTPLAATTGSKFLLKRVVATGNPVTLSAPNYQAGVEAERLEYDFEQRLLVLGDSHSVRMKHERFEVSAQGGIEYQVSAEGTLGDLWAGGPGEFSGQISPDSDERLVATWGQRLQVHRQGEHQLLSLEGGASVSLDSFGGLRSGKLHLWLKPASTSDRAEPQQPALAYQADRMLAEENVVIQSPMLSGQVERLEAWFRDGSARLADPATHQLAGPMRRLPAPRQDGSDRRQTPSHRFDLKGRQARLHFLRHEREYAIDEVAVEGGVDLRELGGAADELPLRVRGDLLVLQQAQTPQATLRMLGNPAQLTGRGMTIRGGEVLVDRSANTIEIPTAGHLQLPLSAEMPLLAFTSTTDTAAGRAFPAPLPPAAINSQPPSLLDVTWQKGCLFDGRTAYLHDQVEIGSGTQVASADSLTVTLDRAIDFQQTAESGRASSSPGRPVPPQSLPPPQVQSLRLDGNVRMEQQERDPQGQLVSIQRAALPMLQVNQSTGEILSDGAGWFETVRYGSSLASPSLNQANRAAAAAAELIHLKIHYAQGIRGDLRSKRVRCFDQVQAIYGPVAHWDQRLDLWRPETHGPKAIIMRCDQLQAAAMGAVGKQAIEMTALGNTTVQGQLFTATCHRISYDGTKELLVMEGDGRNDAEVTQQSRAGGQQSHAAARQIFFSLRDQSFHVNDAKYLDLNGPFAAGGF